MQAAVFYAPGDIRVENVSEPSPPRGTEVILAPRFGSICGTDLHEYVAGPIYFPVDPATGAVKPQVMGHEFSALVVETGPEVRGSIRPGDRVTVCPLNPCGECHLCRGGLGHLCHNMSTTGFTHPGGFAEKTTVLEKQIVSLPDEISLEQGALMEPTAVGVYAAKRAKLSVGDAVLVTGGGPIGSIVSLVAMAAGASQVFVTETNAKRAAKVAALGVTAVFDPRSVDVSGELLERTAGRGIDVAFECAGIAAALEDCVLSCRPRGTIAQVALHMGRSSVTPSLWTEKDLTIVGTWCYETHDWHQAVGLVAAGSLPVEKVITSYIPLKEVVNSGIKALLDPKTAEQKVLVTI